MESQEQVTAPDSDGDQVDLAGPEAGQQIDKIREIIFGGQMRDYEQRFALLERQLTERTQRLGDDLTRRLDTMEKDLRNDLGKLGEQLVAEARERGAERDSAAQALREADTAIKARLDALTKSGGEEMADVRSVIQRNSADFHDALLNLSERLDRALEQAASQLEDAKVSRADLAGLLTDVASRLRREDS